MREDTVATQLTGPILGLIAAIGLGGVIAGAVKWEEDWGPALVVSSGLVGGCALLGWWARSWIAADVAAIAATAAGMVLVGLSIREAEPLGSWVLVAGGVVGLLGAAAVATIVHLMLRLLRGGGASNVPQFTDRPPAQTLSQPAADHLARIEQVLHELHDLASVSEGARRELFPIRDLEIIHHRLEQALAMGDLTAAEVLVSSAQSLGHEGLVPALRSRILEEKRRVQQQQAAVPMQEFEAALQRRAWAAAFQHAAAVRAISPDPATAAHLEQRVEAARHEHRHALEQRFLEAGERDDVETAMATLKELDKYMTREEAERLSREAQRVIQRHRERLTATFQAAVQERRWSDAARVGNAIMAEYPNTRMAEEVRSMIEVIRTRATQTALARE